MKREDEHTWDPFGGSPQCNVNDGRGVRGRGKKHGAFSIAPEIAADALHVEEDLGNGELVQPFASAAAPLDHAGLLYRTTQLNSETVLVY